MSQTVEEVVALLHGDCNRHIAELAAEDKRLRDALARFLLASDNPYPGAGREYDAARNEARAALDGTPHPSEAAQ